MKKFFTLVVLALLAIGCAKEYDDSGLRELINGLDLRVSELESSVSALQSTLGDGKFVRKVDEYRNPDTGRTTGVTVTYTDGNVVHFTIVPTDPSLGPVFSVIRNGAGELVWAVDGQAIQLDGEEIPVYQTPTFSIDDEGNLLVEVDGKTTNLGPVKNEGATLQDGIFTNLAVTDSAVVLTLSDGSTVNIPFAEAFKLNIETTEFTFGALDPIEIPYTVSAKTEATVVNVAGYSPKEFKVEVTADKIVVTPLSKKAAAVMMAYADSKVGLVSVVNLTVEAEGFELTDTPYSAEYDYVAEGEDAVIEANAVSNISFEVKPVEEWIHVASVKSTAYVITLKLDDNKTGEVREGTVNVVKAGTEEVIQTIKIAQLPAEAETGPANLSKKESANSYLVYAPGEYKFAAVKGNSTESVGAVAKAEVLWESDNTTTAPAANAIIASVSVDGEFVVFSTPETLVPGNALIAAKDASDVILWSWHIWIPATEIVNSTFGDVVAAPMMDRNLGALVPAVAGAMPDGRSIGMFYQWGRKDPFPGTSSVESSTPIATNGTITLASDKQNYTIEEAIQNPTVYVKTGGDSNKTWMADKSEATNALWGIEKTIYDPCPPGYIVPTRDKENSPMWAGNNLTVDTANKIMMAGEAVFPVGGYLDQGEYVKVGARAYLWSSYASSGDHDIAYYLIADGGSASVSQQRMSRGGNVRCIVADESAIVPPTPNPGGGDEPADPTVDLSKDGSANSYVVTAAGDFKFKAVKGNGTESVGTVAKAELVWETDNTATAPEVNAIIAKVGFEDGYVTFSTPETLKPGNALIAVKDASDVILWSWHIWIPATEVKVWDSEAFAGAKMMDRNLGALVATNKEGDVDPLSIGLYYQWGRKDPFPGATEFVNKAPRAAVAGTDWTYHKDLISTDYAIQHPTEYASVPEVDSGVWNAADPDDLWNNSGTKSVYDPCPVGYKVPSYDDSMPMWHKSDEGWTFEANRFNYGDYYFTIAGYIDCWGASYAYADKRTHIWTNKWKEETKSYCLYVRLDKDSKYYDKSFHKAKAGSVRCVVE